MEKLDKKMAKKVGVEEESKSPADDEIDVRLDQDLSDFAIPPKKSLFKEIELDIDLTGPFGIGDKFVEPQVLDINPLRSFSRQVEINLGRLNRNGYISPEQPNTPLSSTFRTIKRPLLNNVLGKGATVVDNANLIMITSALSGEGKTFTALKEPGKMTNGACNPVPVGTSNSPWRKRSNGRNRVCPS